MMTLLLILLFDALKEEPDVIEDNDDDTSLPASETTVGDPIKSEHVTEDRGAAATIEAIEGTREEADDECSGRFLKLWRSLAVMFSTLVSTSLQGADRFLILRRGAMVVSVAILVSSLPLPLPLS